jgi:hypothetical protein
MSATPTGSGPHAGEGAPRIVATPGKLPEFPQRSVVFVANLLGLFFGNREKTRLLAEQVGEVDSYGGRLLPVIDLIFRSDAGNLLVLEREPDLHLSRFLQDVVGLSLPELAILPHEEYREFGRSSPGGPGVREGDDDVDVDHPVIKRIAAHPAAWMDGYVTDRTLTRIADVTGKRTMSSYEGSYDGNNKLLLHRHLEAEGLPVVATEMASNPDEINRCLARLRDEGFRAGVIKSSLGASGIGLIKVPSLAARREASDRVPDHFFREGPCLVQGWLAEGERGVRRLYSPSAQLFLDSDSITIYDLTEQILSRSSVHEGNEAPPPYLAAIPALREELLRQAGVAARWLHARGYRGTASADFLVTELEDDSFAVYVCELNARITGATYPAVLARHLMPGGTWLMRNLRFDSPLTGEEVLQALRRSGDLFDPESGDPGVLPVNFNFGLDGLVHKGQFLCLAPSVDESEALLRFAERDLPCTPDRD